MSLDIIKIIVPIQLSKSPARKEINLFLHDDHYFLIHNMNRLLSKHGVNKSHFCKRCCQGFKTETAFKNHAAMCEDHKQA